MYHASSVTSATQLADARHAGWASSRGAPLAEQQLNARHHSFSAASKPVAAAFPWAPPPMADKPPRFSFSQELPPRPIVPLAPMQDRPVKRAHSAPVRWWSRGMQVAVSVVHADTGEASARAAAPSLPQRAAIEKRGHKRNFSTSSERSRPPAGSSSSSSHSSRATSAPSSGHGRPVVPRRSPTAPARHLAQPTSALASDDARPSQLRRTQLLVRRGAALVPAGPRSSIVTQTCPHEHGSGRCPLRLCRARQPPSAAPSPPMPSSPILHSTQPCNVAMSQPRPA